MLKNLLNRHRPFLIAEVAQAHEGSVGLAQSFIDAAAKAGANAIKFQTHIALEESTYDEPWRVAFSVEDKTRFDYWKRMEFSKEHWGFLKEYAEKAGLVFLSSPFSVAAVEMLDSLGMNMWKVPSGEISNPELLDAMINTGKPILFSSGMSTLTELSTVIERAKKNGNEFGVFQCTSEYPCPPARWGLNVISKLKSEFQCPVGLSDHSATVAAPIAAVALGAELIETHVTFDKNMFGPDAKSSLTFAEFAIMAEGCRNVRASLESPVDKAASVAGSAAMKAIFTRSLALKKDMKKGEILKDSDLTLKKPGTGISFERKSQLLGKKLKTDVDATRLLKEGDFE